MNATTLVTGRIAQLDTQIDLMEKNLLRDEASFQCEKLEAQESFAARARKLKSERDRLTIMIQERELLMRAR